MKKEKKMIWLLTGIAAVSLLVLCTVVIVRTATYPFIRTTGPDGPPRSVEPSAQAVERLAGGIRIPTVSDAIDRTDDNPFQAFKAYLPQAYPAIYSRLDTLTINEYGLVFRWPGKNPALPPILLCSHYDVVPVLNYDPSAPDAPLPGWDYPPFSGAVADGRIYGRGTLDMKGMLFSILEATDSLLAEGFRPERDVWIALGFDEETGGTQGALKIARYFEEQGIAFDAVYDEGGIIIAPGLGGIQRTAALVGTAEKGFSTIRITVRGTGGHSSMPPEKGSLVLAAEIIEMLNQERMPAFLTAPVIAFLDRIGGSMGVAQRTAIANRWLLESPLLRSFESNPATNALVRTTTAITMARGSDAANVLASEAEVTVNFRLLPGNTTAQVKRHVENICNGYDVRIEELSTREPSQISPDDVHAFEMIRTSLAGLYPGTIVTPYLTLGGTAICGGSAIAAVAPVIDADENQTSLSLATIFILNAVALFVFPVIGHWLGMGQTQFGTWAAIAIHDTSSVVGAGAAYGEEALKVATTVKLTRALWIIPLSLVSALIFRQKGKKIQIPWFIFWFVVAMLVNTYCNLPTQLTHGISVAARCGLSATLFLIGGGLSIEVIRKVGLKPLVLGIILWAVISVASLAVILLL